jgi:imidazole glycerol phosphate synthase subunit HisF
VASMFHFGQHTIDDAKRAMRARGVRVRIES